VARVRALVRRAGTAPAPLLSGAGIELDPTSRTVRRNGDAIELTAKEFQVLHLLMSRPSRVFSRAEIMEHIYDDDHDAGSNVVDVFLSRLRRKIHSADSQDVLRTVRGVGYAFDAATA
jgi:DNA-binding response OmpR family regulator